jgi:hypothetical protein
MKTRMVDRSRWQGPLNPGLVAGAGIDGVWIKACGATATATTPVDPFHVDPYFAGNVQALKVWNHDNPDPGSVLIPGVFAYLVPGPMAPQAALLWSLLRSVGGPEGFAVKVDVEEKTLTEAQLIEWYDTWKRLARNDMMSPAYPTVLYTRKNLWSYGDGRRFTPALEEAHWVDATYRAIDRDFREQERGIYPDWWDVDYKDGWPTAFGLQYTDSLRIGTARTTCSLYWCRRSEFVAQLIR